MLQYMSYLNAWFRTRRSDERGATMVEYGLMVALIAVVVAVAATTLGGGISTLFNRANGSLGNPAPAP